MNIAGFAGTSLDASRQIVMGGGATQEVLLIGSLVIFGVVLLSCALGLCSRGRVHPCAARYTSSRR